MKSIEVRAIVALVVLSFGLTLAIQWIRQVPRAPLQSLAAVVATSGGRPATAAASPSAAAAVAARSARVPAPAIEVPPSEDNGPALPVLFAISSVRSGVARQVDVQNNSDGPLDITVVAMDGPTQERTVAQMFLPPNSEEHVGSESGLRLEPGYQVTLRSSGYRELNQTVR
jgi:hypothetical protein